MDTLTPDEFLKQLIATREAFWEQMNAERKSYGAEKPLSPGSGFAPAAVWRRDGTQGRRSHRSVGRQDP